MVQSTSGFNPEYSFIFTAHVFALMHRTDSLMSIIIVSFSYFIIQGRGGFDIKCYGFWQKIKPLKKLPRHIHVICIEGAIVFHGQECYKSARRLPQSSRRRSPNVHIA
jgi:hypothetical protein